MVFPQFDPPVHFSLLQALTNRLQLENEQLRDKLEQCSRDYHFQVSNLGPFSVGFVQSYFHHGLHQINELETELAEIKGIKDKLHRCEEFYPLSRWSSSKYNTSGM